MVKLYCHDLSISLENTEKRNRTKLAPRENITISRHYNSIQINYFYYPIYYTIYEELLLTSNSLSGDNIDTWPTQPSLLATQTSPEPQCVPRLVRRAATVGDAHVNCNKTQFRLVSSQFTINIGYFTIWKDIIKQNSMFRANVLNREFVTQGLRLKRILLISFKIVKDIFLTTLVTLVSLL